MNPKRSIAYLMRRFPFLYPLLVYLLKTVAARFTVGVTGVVFNQEGDVLLLEHVFRGHYPWGLPGGWVRRRERPQDGLRRELLEEVGLAVRVGPTILVELDGPPGHLETGFLCEIEGEMDHLSGEILAACWVSPDALPDGLYWLDREMIQRAQALRDRPMGQQPTQGGSKCREKLPSS
ncbi:MAG TPA: NUDIX hydrolase [Chloroflexi bacterium]|nr:NUDIX hydrolase [Chloroflexota bacterium]